MPSFEELHSAAVAAEEAYRDAAAARDAVVKPILEAMGKGRVGIESVIVESNSVFVDYGWSCRGQVSTDTILLPLSIFRDDNPVQAATKYKAGLDHRKEQAHIAAKREQLARLQRELGEVPHA